MELNEIRDRKLEEMIYYKAVNVKRLTRDLDVEFDSLMKLIVERARRAAEGEKVG